MQVTKQSAFDKTLYNLNERKNELITPIHAVNVAEGKLFLNNFKLKEILKI